MRLSGLLPSARTCWFIIPRLRVVGPKLASLAQECVASFEASFVALLIVKTARAGGNEWTPEVRHDALLKEGHP